MNVKISAMVSAIALVCVCTTSTFAQKLDKSKVPAVVIQAFSQQFHGATRVKWELEEANMYEVNFRQQKTAVSAKFDQTGKLLETETAIKAIDLPASVLQTVKTQFAGFKIEEMEKIVFANGSVAYELELEKGKQSLEVQFDVNGKVLKQEAEKKD